MEVIKRLINKKTELEKRWSNQYQGGSQRKESLEYRIKMIEELANSYQTISLLPSNVVETAEILRQQVGFEEQKKRILEESKIEEFSKKNEVQKSPLILGLVGAPGVGKTAFAKLLAQSLQKKYFLIALGGLTDVSVLTGKSENSSGSEAGQLAKALIETKTCDPVILLDEIDKLGVFSQNSLYNCLLNVLDEEQNQEILDYYLDVKLDFSRVTFIITANDFSKIPKPLRSRIGEIIKIPPYTIEQKKEIAQKFIQKRFLQNKRLSQNNFEITEKALETLINKTKEKGARQLKLSVDRVFNYCLLQWSQKENLQEARSKIVVTPELVNEIIPADFSNVDQEEEEHNELELQKEKKHGEKFESQSVELADIKQQNEKLEKKLNFFVKFSLCFVFFIISIAIVVICYIFSRLEIFKRQSESKKQSKEEVV
jgi:ATP-dependent Lon protease